VAFGASVETLFDLRKACARPLPFHSSEELPTAERHDLRAKKKLTYGLG
jgi:hypothetical protein